MIRLKRLFATATIFAAAVCAGPVHAGFQNSDPLDAGLSLPDVEDAPAAGWRSTDLPTGPYYMAWDIATGNTYVLTGSWWAIGNCTADKCVSDMKDAPVAAQAAVPEPGMLALLGLALGLLGFTARRHNA